VKKLGRKWIALFIICYCLTAAFGAAPSLATTSIAHGQYLIDMSENAVTIMWFTSNDATGKVEYGTGGRYTNSVTEVEDGLVSVGKRHSVRLTGLTPGTVYNYRVVSTEVTDLLAYSPTLGNTVTSANYTFKTFDPSKASTTFYFITDPQDDNPTGLNKLLALIDKNDCDFVLITGDMVESVESESQIFAATIDPIVKSFGRTIPLVLARGNHDMRGHYARSFYNYFPNSTGQWYYGFVDGPAAFGVLDTGEDKADSSDVFSGLTTSEPYTSGPEYSWLQSYLNSSQYQSKPMKLLFGHMPGFAFDPNVYPSNTWKTAANNAGSQLYLSGHGHYYENYYPGTYAYNFNALMLGRLQIAKVKVTATEATVTSYDDTGKIIHSFVVPHDINNMDISGSNLAFQKPVTSSSDLSIPTAWGSSRVVDGINKSTNDYKGWSSNSNVTVNHTESITVDLGKNYNINQVNLFPVYDGANTGIQFPIDFNIQVSTNNTTWTTVASRTGYAQPANEAQGISVGSQTARYVKVTGTKLRPNPNEYNYYRMQIGEIEVYGGNLSANRTVGYTSSYEAGSAGWGAATVTDSTKSSMAGYSMGWSSNNSLTANHTESVTIDLGATNSISKVDLYPRNDPGNVGTGFPVDFNIKVSTDNNNWTTVTNKTGYAQPGNAAQSFTFTLVNARYVKVEGTNLRQVASDSNHYRMQLAEIQVFN